MALRDIFSTKMNETSALQRPCDVDEYIEKNDANYLFEKNRSPTKWRWKLRMLNLTGFLYFVIYSVSALFVGVLVTLPELYGDDPNLLWNRNILAIYMFFMLFANYILIVLKFKRSKFGVYSHCLPAANHSHWSKCQHCDIMVPPRTKHCILCDCCVLKRDHHCFFAGCCISFHNQRYFIVFCYYGCLGALFSLYATFSYLDKYYTTLLSLDFYGYLIPWVLWRWVCGYVHHSIIWFVILFYLSVATLLACLYFFAWQILLLFTGQTTYEFLKKNNNYKQPLYENLQTVFGNWSFLNFVCPLPWICNLGDGMEWKTYCGSEEKHC